jgi:hypothetical protein
MCNAYIIEIGSHTAGIVTRDERSFRFFSSDRIFDSLEGREFRSARDAERAARALFLERRHLVSGQLFAAFESAAQGGRLSASAAGYCATYSCVRQVEPASLQ